MQQERDNLEPGTRVRVINPESGAEVGNGGQIEEYHGWLPEGTITVRLDPLSEGGRSFLATYPTGWVHEDASDGEPGGFYGGGEER